MSSFFEVSQLTIASSAYKPPEPTSKKSTARLTSTLFHTGLLLSCHLWRCSSALLRQLRLRDKQLTLTRLSVGHSERRIQPKTSRLTSQ